MLSNWLSKLFVHVLKHLIYLIVAVPYLLVAIICAAIGRLRRSKLRKIVFGVSPLISNVYWSEALRRDGWNAETWMTNTPHILDEKVFTLDISKKYGRYAPIGMAFLFLRVLIQPIVVFTTCDGFLLGQSVIWRSESHLLKFSGSKSIVVPYGGDSYVYRDMASSVLQVAVQLSYPLPARHQDRLSRRVRYWTKNADIFIPGIMYQDGFGRTDVLMPSPWCIDVDSWKRTSQDSRKSADEPIVVTHSPNHRGFKGTEFIVKAVQALQESGYNVKLLLLEKKSNHEVKEVLLTQSDIHIDQLIADLYAFSGIESLAAGVPTIANFSNEKVIRPLLLWSYLAECPIVSATPETIYEVLKDLLDHPEKRERIAHLSRQYAESRHSYEHFSELYRALHRQLTKGDENLLSRYIPD